MTSISILEAILKDRRFLPTVTRDRNFRNLISVSSVSGLSFFSDL